jgi:hypothetical protein
MTLQSVKEGVMEIVGLTGTGTMVGSQLLSLDATAGVVALLALFAASATAILWSRAPRIGVRPLRPTLRLDPAPAGVR